MTSATVKLLSEILATLSVAGLLYLALGYMVLCYLDSCNKPHNFHPVRIFLNWPRVLVVLIREWWANRRTK